MVGGRFGGRSRRLVQRRGPPFLAIAFALLLTGCYQPPCQDSVQVVSTNWAADRVQCDPGVDMTLSPDEEHHVIVICRCRRTAVDAGAE